VTKEKKTRTKRLLVLGGGPAGYAGAFHAADLGLDVTLVDREPNPGGVCLYRGCIPSKALLHAAKILREARDAADLGIRFGDPEIDLDRLRDWKNGVVDKLTRGLGSLRKARGIRFLQGRGSFEDSHTLHVDLDDEGTETVRFDFCLLATGGRSIIPQAFDIQSDRVIDSEAALRLDDIPKVILVVGGGYIGLEMGTVYAALGSQVHVVEMAGSLLPEADRDLVKPLHRELEKQVASIHLNTKVVGLKEIKQGVRVELSGLRVDEPELTVDKVLVCVGRRPVTKGFGLENTKVELDERGFCVVDDQRRTTDSAIFAVGDIAGPPLLAHKGSYEARKAAEVISGQPATFDAQAIPAVMYTDPEVAWAGLTEAGAQERNLPVKVVRFPWNASGRALTMNRRQGLTKVVVHPQTHQVLGVGVVGPGAGELLAEGAFAVEIGARIEDLGMTVHAHPTLSETVMEAAELFFGSSTHFYGKM